MGIMGINGLNLTENCQQELKLCIETDLAKRFCYLLETVGAVEINCILLKVTSDYYKQNNRHFLLPLFLVIYVLDLVFLLLFYRYISFYTSNIRSFL